MSTADANDPRGFDELSADQQAVLLDWIRSVLKRATRVFPRSSYDMKHDFEGEPDGFYVTNGQFKGAMREAGFLPEDPRELNWRFRVQPARQLEEEEKQRLGWIGRNWLVKDRWREKGYIVIRRNRLRRTEDLYRMCVKENCPAIRVELRGHCARVVMDMITADWKLTPAAVEEVAALLAAIDPKGKNWWNVNDCYNDIRRVPVYRAEEVAAKLVAIAGARRLQVKQI